MSSSVSDVHSYLIIRKLLDSVFSILLLFIHRWGIRHAYTGLFFRKVAYISYDVLRFVQ
jgi:hypothetical protein